MLAEMKGFFFFFFKIKNHNDAESIWCQLLVRRILGGLYACGGMPPMNAFVLH